MPNLGPRVLGNRSILGDARNQKMQKTMNLKIKYRESFRPFAPSCLEEKVSDYFEIKTKSPYMLLVSEINQSRRINMNSDQANLFGIDKLNIPKSDIPAITHVDYSARIQTVDKKGNSKLWALLQAFKQKTNCSVLINTSFNVRGEPIVHTPYDAYRCFRSTDMDVLVIQNFVFEKRAQPEWQDKEKWLTQFKSD